MKKNILFVDDEPMILQGIQRSLRPMRAEWNMEFAEGGQQAQEYLARNSYDVVLTDMMMPGMDGVALLGYFKEHAPRTIRLVLSGHAEQHLAIKCVGLAHQYLSKPCDPATLQHTIGRVTAPGFALRSEPVMSLVGQLEHLPSLPLMYSRMVEMLSDPETSMEDVGKLIEGDMAMTAKLLQIVNSSFFGLSRQVTKPVDAASFLGLDTLKSLVLATNVFGEMETKMPAGFSTEMASHHSQSVGAAARAIAKAEGVRSTLVDEALLAGLLHDVGKLVLASSLPEKFEKMDKSASSPLEEEQALFGATHAEVGGYLLGLWGLPSPVVDAITWHHAPIESSTNEFSALTAVHVANHLVQHQTPPELDMTYLTKIGLAERLPVWRNAVQELSQS